MSRILPSGRKLEQARRSRDARFDGRFFIGVRTTGIYCRPICPVKMPRAENVTFFDSPSAAAEAGFRPCLRCRPESSPGTPAWRGSSATVVRALRLINDGALDEDSLVGLAERLGVTARHLSRLFAKHLGAAPKTVAQTRRLQFAKKLIDETRLPMTEIALSSGYGSVRRFNDHFRQVYDRSPTQLRAGKGRGSIGSVELSIPFRKPYDFSSLLDFYSVRAIPGVETVLFSAGANKQRQYVRQFQIGSSVGRVTVQEADNDLLCCRVEGADVDDLMSVVQRVRRMFDVDALPLEINAVLAADDGLRPLINQNPGLRLPGAFDEFEIAVRAIVGQQVSVKGATTVMGGIAKKYGTVTSMGLVFPSADRLADIDPSALPMPQKRALAIKELSRQIATDTLRFDQDETEFLASLLRIPGIGPWTSQYILMRAQGDPDAFLHGDLVLKKAALSLFGSADERGLIARAEAWRPWRGYAGMHLWRYAGDQKL
ncbi:MAG: AraC family transcriptional regulator of adaptative response / DNA-3-methyladenine glycosylase II [Candidatus Azotimanducaceae bacterium]|jgi:AraC family transcriptional regulator of adaptative response / DNA-3-methyladenine glycosylase II